MKNFAVPYPADCRTGRALGIGKFYLADKRVIDFDFLSVELPPAFAVASNGIISVANNYSLFKNFQIAR